MEQNFKIAVPEGCKAEIKQENGFLVVTFDPAEWEPKDGDVVAFGIDPLNPLIAIYKNSYTNNSGDEAFRIYAVMDGGTVVWYEHGWLNNNMRPATEEEKQRLFDALEKDGKRWNTAEKRIEDLPRWRAKRRCFYYYIAMDSIVLHVEETFNEVDGHRYNFGNYFKTREAAEKVAEQIREIFKHSKSE